MNTPLLLILSIACVVECAAEMYRDELFDFVQQRVFMARTTFDKLLGALLRWLGMNDLWNQ